MTIEEIGINIRTMRLSRGWSQNDLAKIAHISQSSIAMYERGKRRPNDEQAEALADAFNVPKWSIFYREDEVIPIEDIDGSRIVEPETTRSGLLSQGVSVMTDEQMKQAAGILSVVFPNNKYFKEAYIK